MPRTYESRETRDGPWRRLIYGAVGALVLIGLGVLLSRYTNFQNLLRGDAQVERAAPRQETAREAREEFEKERAAREKSVEAPAAAMPVGADGYFVPRSMSSVPDGPFGDSVWRGLMYFLNTGTNAGEYVGNDLACANCHLDRGRLANSAPMWAAAVSYPTYRGKNKRINTLEDRIRGCFTYSMNGAGSPSGGPPPRGHQVLKDLQSYFFFLADGAPLNEKLQGKSYPDVPKPDQGYDRERGAQVFAANCVVCHGEDGAGRRDLNGRVIFPSLWGPGSFNWGAGMHRVNTAAAFIKANMPLGRPNALSDQDAWDVAAFVNSHERPPDPRQKGISVAETRERYHSGSPDYYGQRIDGELLDGVPNISQNRLEGREESSRPVEKRGAVGSGDPPLPSE